MTERVHIAHVLSSFGMGGQERVALDLATGQLEAGFRVTALSLAPSPDGPLAAEFQAAGAEVARVERYGQGFDPRVVLRLAAWLRRRGVRLAHTHNRMALVYGAPAGRLARCAVVHTKHGSNPGSRAQVLVARGAATCVDAFVAVSPETADWARGRREVDPRRLSVIANGIALSRFHPDGAARARVRAELGIDAGAWVIGSVGRIAAEKNQALLLRAAAPLLGPRVRLAIAGDGPLLPELRALAAALGVAPWVHLLGARLDVPAVLNAFDVFVLSSDTEGLPLAIPEAMATALPVVATAVGGVPTVVDPGRTGFLVSPRDEAALRERLAALGDDLEAARACGERARAAALERFSSERMHREYLALYERVLQRAGRR